MAKSKSSDDIIFEALTKAYKSLPTTMPLCGSKSLFTAAQTTLAQQAVQDGYLTKSLGSSPGGKGKPKQIEFGVLTKAGILKVVEKDSPKAVLEALLPVVEKLGKPTASPSPSDFKAAMETSTAACVAAIRDAFAGLQREVLHHLTPSDGSADPTPVLAAIRAALGKVEPIVVNVPAPAPATQPIAPPPTLSATDLVALGSEVVAFVKRMTAERTVGCDFPELFDHLQKRHPKLTIGTFHDALRALDDAGRIRLKDWPRMLDEMPRPELALFVTHTVMYHVQLPQ